MTLPRHSAGLTLIEVMVSIVIALILMAVTVSIFVGNKRSYNEQEEMSRLQENARFALDMLTRDIRLAGYVGCSHDGTAVHNHTATAYDFVNVIEGWESSEAGGKWHPTTAAAPSAVTGGGDGITVRYLDTDMLNVNADMSGDLNAVVSVTAPTSSKVVNAGDVIGVSDCVSTDIFAVSGVTAPGAYPGTMLIQHTGGSAVNDGVCSAAAGALCESYKDPFALVSRGGYREYHYYIGDDDCDNTTADATGARNLCRAVGGGAGAPLAEGIEHMEILYGEDTSGDKIADVYQQADAVTNWANVVSVQIGLVARTPQPYGIDIDGKTYTVLNGTYGPMNDRYRRRVYTTTVQLRNRMN
ncbi:MAG TPA: PilW family protein [Gammaproteobacteria bacterium]|nr:PilW family protein [Gammaproteobacteria bacterium]